MNRCPSGAEIIAYLERALEAEEQARLETHLDTCPECAEQVRELGRINDLIASQACPPEEIRMRVALGEREGADLATAVAHMQTCPRCREELAAVAEAVAAEVAPEPAPSPRAVEPMIVPLSQVPLAEDAPPYTTTAALRQMEVELQCSGQYSGLSVSVAVRERLTGRPQSGVIVRVQSEDGKETAEALTDDAGIARLALRALRPSWYFLEIGPERLSLEIRR